MQHRFLAVILSLASLATALVGPSPMTTAFPFSGPPGGILQVLG